MGTDYRSGRSAFVDRPGRCRPDRNGPRQRRRTGSRSV